MNLDISFEDDILSCALRSDDFVKRASRMVDTHHFATKERSWIWKTLKDTWIKYKERPTLKIFVQRARDEFPDSDDRRGYLLLLKQLAVRKPRAPKAALAELGTFVRKVEFQKAAEDLVDCLGKDDLDGAEKVFHKGTRITTKERDYSHISFIEEFSDRQKQRKYQVDHPEEFTVIPTGFRTLDRAMAGGIRIGELGLIMGTTSRGKSVVLSNMAHTAVSKGFKCLYIALEMPARQIATRHDSRMTSLRYDQFKSFSFMPSELRQIDIRHRKLEKRWRNRFHIISWPVRSADINSVRNALEDLRVEHNFEPNLIVVDSGDHLNAIESKKDGFRLQQAEVYWSLKRLAEEDAFAILSSVQAGREWATRTATAEAASEAYDKSRIADLVFSINDPNSRHRKTVKIEDDEEDEEDAEAEIKGYGAATNGVRKLEGHIAKYRDGDSKITFPIEADFARMRISEPKEEEATE